jgi:phage portal protein BeeE
MGDIATVMRPVDMRAGSYSLQDYYGWLQGLMGNGLVQTWEMNQERIEADFPGLVTGAYQRNGVVFACLQTRAQLFSQVRFQFQQLRGGQPGDLFGTPELRIVENPEPGMQTGDLLNRAIANADLAGDWFGVRRPGPRRGDPPRIKTLRPDWTIVIIGSPNVDADTPADDPDAEVIGYQYWPGGFHQPTSKPWNFLREEVAHFFPVPDPIAKYRGMPLVTAILRDIAADSAASAHKLAFFEHAATPNMVVRFPPGVPESSAKDWIDLFEQEHKGVTNAYRTMYLGAGAEADVVGRDMQQLDFKATQGAGQTIIAAALNVHPTVVGLSEGLQGSSLNSGNFGAARRLVADKMLRPAWGNFAGSLQTIVLPPQGGTRLWYDDRHVPFLAEDVKDAAEILNLNAQSIRSLGDGGWLPDTIIDAVVSGDLRRLQHTGAYSVQLQQPGAQMAASVTFWPSTAALPGAVIERGTLLNPGHPIVLAYPSLFGRAEGVAA